MCWMTNRILLCEGNEPTSKSVRKTAIRCVLDWAVNPQYTDCDITQLRSDDMKKRAHAVVALFACIFALWISGNTTSLAAKRLMKVTEPSLVKPVHLKVKYLYGTSETYNPYTDGRYSWNKRTLTGKIKVSKKYSKRVYYIYRQGTVRQGSKKLVYYYVQDKDKVYGGWVHRSNVSKAKSTGYMKEIKDVYNIVKNNATAWSFAQTKLVLGNTNPSYPYDAKTYAQNLGGGYDILPDIADSHISDVVTQLVYGMQKNHKGSLGTPPFDAAATLKNGKTMLMLYHYYQKRGRYFEIPDAPKFEEGINHPETLTGIEADTGYFDGEEGTPVYGFMTDLQYHILRFVDEYNK